VPKTPIRRKSKHEKSAIVTNDNFGYLQEPRGSSLTRYETPNAPHPQPSAHCEAPAASTLKIRSLSKSHTASFPRSLQSKASTSTGFASLSTAYDSSDRAVTPAPSTTWKQDSEIPLSDPPAPTSLKGAFLKMFSKTSPNEQNAATGLRSASRQSQRVSILLPSHIHITKVTPLTCSTQPKTPSRSASRLDDRQQKDVLFDIHESDAAAAASWKSLFRSRCPTPRSLSPTQHFDFGVEESRSPMPSQSSVAPPSDAHRHRSMTFPDEVTTRDESRDGNVFRRSYSSRSTSYSARDLVVPSSPPPVAVEVQALTTDTHVSMKKPLATATNFSMPRAQTAARETMEVESVTARVQMLEDDMLDLQARMLDLEELIKEQRNAAITTQPSRIVTNPKAYTSHTAASRAASSPIEHRTSQDNSTTSTWPRESSSDVASIASSRSSTDDFMDSTITLQHPKHDPNLNQAQPDYAASPKLYKMFIESKTDMDSLQSAITKLRADAASSLRLSGSNSAASSRRSMAEEAEDDPFVLTSPSTTSNYSARAPDTFSPTSTSTSSNQKRREEAATLRRPTTSHDTRRRDSETHQDMMDSSAKSTPQRSATQKRSSAIFGTAMKARQVLGGQAFEVEKGTKKKGGSSRRW